MREATLGRSSVPALVTTWKALPNTAVVSLDTDVETGAPYEVEQKSGFSYNLILRLSLIHI